MRIPLAGGAASILQVLVGYTRPKSVQRATTHDPITIDMAADKAGPSTQNSGDADKELSSKLQDLSTHDEGDSDDSGDEEANNAGPAEAGAAKKKKKNKKKKKGKGKSTELRLAVPVPL